MAKSFVARGACDVHSLVIDERRGLVSFVKNMTLACDATGERTTLRVQYNFMQAVESTYEPSRYRSDEDRRTFGFFEVGEDQVVDADTGYLEGRDYITRLNLKTGKTFDFEIHPTVPEICHRPIAEAVESWNDVFERRCGVRPLRTVLGSADAMPADLDHHVIFFRKRGYFDGGYSAYGPSVALAHTGEIVDADVVVDGTSVMMEYKKMQAAGAEGPSAPSSERRIPEDLARAPEQPVRTVFLLDDRPLPMIRNEPDVFGGQAAGEPAAATAPAAERFHYLIRGLICHELGHCLGLRHNFSASCDLANIPEGQLGTSIMDYIWPERRACDPGPYDEAAIAFGYGGTVHEGDRRFTYLTDEDSVHNPLANSHDRGEPYEFYKNDVETVLAPLRAGQKPPLSPARFTRVMDGKLYPIAKFINAIDDPRSELAFRYMADLLAMDLPADAEYRPLAHLSAAKVLGGLYLLRLDEITGNELTRNQRIHTLQLTVDAVADRTRMLEDERIRLVGAMANIKHMTALNALVDLRDRLKATAADPSLSPADASVEENVLMYVEQGIGKFLSD